MHVAVGKTLPALLVLITCAEVHADRGAPVPRRAPGPALQAPVGWGRLRNQAQQMCLDAAGWNATAPSNALLWSCNGDPDQVWSLTPRGEIVNAASGLCLSSSAPGRGGPVDVGVERCHGGRNQRWSVVRKGPRGFELRHGRGGACLDVQGRAGAQGDNVMLWACDRGIDQTWWWEPAAPPAPRPLVRTPIPPPPAPVVHVPGPPRPAPVRPIEPGRFQELLRAIKNGSFSADQIAVIEQAASFNHFLVAQLKEIVSVLSFSADQVRAVELVAPRLLDRENGFTLFEAFTFSADRERVKSILERTRPPAPPAPTPARQPVPAPARPPVPTAHASDPYACTVDADCELACPRAPGCCGWPCGCSHAIRRDHRAAYEAGYARTCQRHPHCPAVACARQDAAFAVCRNGRCVARPH